MAKCADLVNKNFGRLTVIKRVENSKNGHARWLCKCECGNSIVTETAHLNSGHTQSCGCYRIEKSTEALTKHSRCKTRLYKIYHGIKKRCYNVNSEAYKYYGARGIHMCDEWLNDFMTFYNWSINNGYSEKLSIDRINVDGNYEPSNCRWVDKITQANNTRKNVYITVNGKTMTISQWSRETGVDHREISRRYRQLIELLGVKVTDLIENEHAEERRQHMNDSTREAVTYTAESEST